MNDEYVTQCNANERCTEEVGRMKTAGVARWRQRCAAVGRAVGANSNASW